MLKVCSTYKSITIPAIGEYITFPAQINTYTAGNVWQRLKSVCNYLGIEPPVHKKEFNGEKNAIMRACYYFRSTQKNSVHVNNCMKGLFIALEGIDGSGKSTQAKMLVQNLTGLGHKAYHTFEPTSGPIGKMIRDIFAGKMPADHRTIAGLFVADRLHHLLNEENGIVRKLQEGFTVVSDRYYFSSYAYHGTHMDMNWVIQANAMSATILRPDVNIFIDVKPETSIQRLTATRQLIEMYETLDNLKNVREKYFEAFDLLKNEENIVMIDGDQSIERLHEDIMSEVQKLLVR